MIDVTTIRAGATLVYVVAFVILAARTRRVPDGQREFCYAALLVIGVAGVAAALTTLEIATVVVNGTAVTVAVLIDDMLAYSLLWIVTARLVGIDGRLLVFVALTPIAQRIAFEVANVSGGLPALLGVVIVVGGLLAFAYVFFGSVWERAQSIPEQRRLLHWKARNLLLFLITMLILYGLLSLVGVFDSFTATTISQYMSVLIRVGFAGFLFANLDAVGDTSLFPSSSTAERTSDAPTAD